MSAIVLSLGLPGAERLRKWARHGETADRSALSELIFVLVWGGIWQLLVVVICVLALLFGGDGPLAPPGMWFTHWVGLIGGLWVFFYALLELFVIMETLWQIAAVIVSEERRIPALPETLSPARGPDPRLESVEMTDNHQ